MARERTVSKTVTSTTVTYKVMNLNDTIITDKTTVLGKYTEATPALVKQIKAMITPGYTFVKIDSLEVNKAKFTMSEAEFIKVASLQATNN